MLCRSHSPSQLWFRLPKFQALSIADDDYTRSLDVSVDLLDPILRNGASIFAVAAFFGASECLNFMIASSGDITSVFDDKGRHLIHFAAASTHLQVYTAIENLIEDTSMTDRNGCTVAHYAALYGNIEVLKYLWINGFDLEAPDHSGNTVMHFAIVKNQLDVIEFLIENDYCLDSRNHAGQIPLMLLTYSRQAKRVLDMFLNHGYDFDQAEILPYFYGRNDRRMVELLLEKGASAEVEAQDGLDLVQHARLHHNSEMVKLFSKYSFS